MPKKEYSVELLKLLEILKTNNPTLPIRQANKAIVEEWEKVN